MDLTLIQLIVSTLAVLVAAFVFIALRKLSNRLSDLPSADQLNLNHREMLMDLQRGLSEQSTRLSQALQESSERQQRIQMEFSERLRHMIQSTNESLRQAVSQELNQTRQGMEQLNRFQHERLSQLQQHHLQTLGDLKFEMQARQDQLRMELIEKMSAVLAEHGVQSQTILQETMRHVSGALIENIEKLNLTVAERLDQISGKMNERLEDGFKKTNETFASVMARLAVIDEAQKKIDGLTSNVVSLQELLGDKRSRGAFGEVQLEHLVRNLLPEQVIQFQAVLSTGVRADCLLDLPAPTGKVVVDAKFPLENYQRMFDLPSDIERKGARSNFVKDVKKHIDDIANKYILPGETSDGAVMFVPAEAVFAEIHAYHEELVSYAQQKRVWIVSPTTLMAVLNTARAVLRDAQMREQLHVMQKELVKLAEEFLRFDKRMKNLATHIEQAHKDVQEVHITSQKISKRFAAIEHVQLDEEVESMAEQQNTSAIEER
ncbi:DNA recombination protein RmuC [Leeia sp. TBRC 13508]|uniref:DNA recombination protein RmuC n=1 Tax=Leeia speluncae TaxID=2884804 RepID=A0ABS8D622_9NEIS|nr:DNA recombination protein RmuC [Leeia speluncae]MCB6183582.1 DNA recombination protein RmuC [Leeia speluncae]